MKRGVNPIPYYNVRVVSGTQKESARTELRNGRPVTKGGRFFGRRTVR